MYTANSIAKKAGTTVRTVQYYDRIGLFSPVDRTDTGYRLYDEDSVAVLREILLYRELGFSISEIRQLLSADETQRRDLTSRHVEKLKRQISDYEDRIVYVRILDHFGVEQACGFLEDIEKKEKKK